MQVTSLRTRTTCRICGNEALAPVIDLGAQALAGSFADPAGIEPVQRRVPLELIRCDGAEEENACGLVQLRHTVPASIMYRSYWYRSGVNRTMTEHLHGISQAAADRVDLKPGDLVVDVGCNDGTLLDGYRIPELRALGVDPSDVARHAEDKGYEVVRNFYSADVVRDRYPNQRARVITTIAMLYDLEDPRGIVRDISQNLAEDGLWVIELHYLASMLRSNGFDAICHEHLEYYSLAVLERLFAECGLEVVSASLNEMNGGSIRLFVGHHGGHQPSSDEMAVLEDLRIKEFEMALEADPPYTAFRERVEGLRRDLRTLIEGLASEGKRIHVYGASTKGNTILQYVGLDHSLIECAADRNPDKWGSETVATRIPIVSEDESRSRRPDYYLILPWHFLPEFIEREESFLSGGGRFIIPLPEIRIVDATANDVPITAGVPSHPV